MQPNPPSAEPGADSSDSRTADGDAHLQLPAQLKLGLDAVAAATTRPQDLAANMSDDQFFEGVTQALRSKSVPFALAAFLPNPALGSPLSRGSSKPNARIIFPVCSAAVSVCAPRTWPTLTHWFLHSSVRVLSLDQNPELGGLGVPDDAIRPKPAHARFYHGTGFSA